MIEINFKNKNDEWHRKNAPSYFASNGRKHYYINGKLHREDGPALFNGYNYPSYWLNSKRYSKENYYKKLKQVEMIKLIFLNNLKQYHREKGPAIINSNISLYHCLNGIFLGKKTIL